MPDRGRHTSPRRRPRVPTDPVPLQRRRALRWAYGFAAFATIAMVALFARVVQLRETDAAPLIDSAGSRRSSMTLHARRGALLDRAGRRLAVTRIGYRLFIDPSLVDDDPWFAHRLAEVIDADPVAIDRLLTRRGGSRYEVLRPLLSDRQVKAIRAFDHPAVGLQARPVRQYPHGRLAGQVLGFTGADRVGLAGAEFRFNDRLAAEDGTLRYVRDAARRAIAADDRGFTPPAHGRDVTLSIDAVVQRITERSLAETCREHRAQAGQAVVMDSRNGQILAMANWPFYDPRDGGNPPARPAEAMPASPMVAEGQREREEAAQAWPPRPDPATRRRNRCVTDPYEPGSIFKPFIHAAATESGKVTPEEKINTTETGYIVTDGGRKLHDAHAHGVLTWDDVLVFSSNIGMAKVGLRLGADGLHDAVRRFGFGAKTGSGLPGESRGIVNPLSQWNHYSVTSIPMGQEIAATPLQMVRAFSAFANGGVMASPTIRAEPNDPPIVKRAIDESAADHTRDVLRRVVTEGTGRRARSDKYRLWGKTGTAQVPDRVNGGYIDNAYTGSFICGAPLRDPRIVVIVVVKQPDPDTAYYGGIVAAPFAKRIVEQTLEYLGEPYDVPSEADSQPRRGPLARRSPPAAEPAP